MRLNNTGSELQVDWLARVLYWLEPDGDASAEPVMSGGLPRRRFVMKYDLNTQEYSRVNIDNRRASPITIRVDPYHK